MKKRELSQLQVRKVDKLSTVPDKRDWEKLKRDMPSDEAKRLCKLAEKQSRKINLLKKQYRRGNSILDPVLVSEMDQITDAIIRHMLSIFRNQLTEEDKLDDLEGNMKDIRESIRDSWRDFSPGDASGIIKFMREHYNLLLGIVYSALKESRSNILSGANRILANNLGRRMGIEPELPTEEEIQRRMR